MICIASPTSGLLKKTVAKATSGFGLKQITQSIFIICLILSFAGCRFGDPYQRVAISGPITLNTEMHEFYFAEPYHPTKQEVKICFRYAGDFTVSSITEPPAFRDGTVLKLDALVTDSSGKVYEFNHITNSSRSYLCVSPQLTDEWMNIAKSGKSFIKLNVRSNRDFPVIKIEWVAVNMWEI